MIGYYVHHHGGGHLARMRCIRSRLCTPMPVLSSLPADGDEPWVRLPLDHDEPALPALAGGDPTAGGTLHWAPRHHPGLRTRMAAIAGWIKDNDPDLLVVDVSVEVATLGRLLGVPVVVVAMRGDRSDRAHRMAYDAADALVAPWPARFAEPGWPAEWLDKTLHTGAFSRLDGTFAAGTVVGTAVKAHRETRVAVLWGSGGGVASGGGGGSDPSAAVDEARAAVSGTQWRLAHAGRGAGCVGRGDAGGGGATGSDVGELLSWADLVVTHAGQGAVAEVAAARKPAVVIADARPHGEQLATAAALDAAGLAVTSTGWPDADHWPDLLARALGLGGRRWSEWNDGHGAERAADFLDRAAVDLRAGRPVELAG